MIIDDEPQVLNAIERDLRGHYHSSYRVIKAGSGTEALETVEELKRRNTPIALFLVDQRRPGMSGTEFLERAIEFYPEARKVLLTAYADTDAAISSINTIGLDHYLMKPWDPPKQHLYPVLDDLLSDWLASVPVPYDGIRVAGTQWSASCHIVKDFLAHNQIPYRWLDIERDPGAKALVETVSKEGFRLPVVFFPDGSLLTDPDSRILAEKVGLHTQAQLPFYDLIIVGGRSGWPGHSCLRGVRGFAHNRDRKGGYRGSSGYQCASRKLSWLSPGSKRGGSGPAGNRPG
jgi:thioredoxin reductase (NADPH)